MQSSLILVFQSLKLMLPTDAGVQLAKRACVWTVGGSWRAQTEPTQTCGEHVLHTADSM